MYARKIFGYGIAVVLVLALTALSLTGCEQPTDNPPIVTLTGITANYTGGSVPVNTGVNSLKNNVTVTAQYSDNTSKTLNAADYLLRGDLSASGQKTVTVTYEDKTATFTVTVTAAPNNAITYTATRADGADGVTSTTGITFTFNASITDLTTNDITVTNGTGVVTKGTLSGSGASWTLGVTVTTAGNVTIAIAKTGIEAGTKDVTVYKAGQTAPTKTLTGITLNTASVKKAYAQDETLNLSGLVVTANYSDSPSTTVTDYNSSPADGAAFTTTGTITVTVSYTEGVETRSSDFTVTVIGTGSDTGTPGLAYEGIPDGTNPIAYRVRKGTVTTGEVHIPAYYRPDADSPYLPVTEIGASNDTTGAFQNTTITDVTIPDSVTSIGNNAFQNCASLTNIIIDTDQVTNTTTTNWGTRFPADNLSVTFKKNVGNGAFSFASANTRLTSVTIAEGVTSIGNNAFNNCASLASITIAEGVTSIGNNAFQNCTSLASVPIPASVTSIGDLVFLNCTSLAGITVDADNPNYASQDGILYNKAKTAIVAVPAGISGSIIIPASVTSIGNNAFLNCTSLTSVTFAAGSQLQTINGFNNCTSLTTITIPASVTSIGNYAFYGCASLANITIPNGVTSIGNSAFSGCASLTTITIPASVTSIGSDAFNNCTSLTEITIPASIASIGIYTFNNCTSLKNITIPASVTSIGNYAFSGCTSLTTITIPASVTSIGNYAFYNCTSLTNVTIAAGVTSIGRYMFQNCTSLTSITIPPSVTTIGDRAFYGTSLASINIPASVATIGNEAFSSCSSLASVTFAADSRLQSIGNNAFSGARITSITIPASVTTIGDSAFSGCTGLASITIPIPENVSISASAFDNTAWFNNKPDGLVYLDKLLWRYKGTMPANTVINDIQAETIAIAISAFQGCTGLTGITIPNSVTSIGESAFSGCTGLTGVTIPNSVTSIGDSAFSGCTGLTSVTFQGTIASGSFHTNALFLGDLRAKYLDASGGIGTYTRSGSGTTEAPYVWTKQ